MTVITGKKAILRLINDAEKQPEKWTLPTFSTPSSEVLAFAKQYAFHPSFIHLLIGIGGNKIDFWRQVIEYMPSGLDGRLLVDRWITWLWASPERGLRCRIGNPALLDACDAVFDVQTKSIEGRVVLRSEWRELRSRLAKAPSRDKIEAAAAGAAAAVAWDLGSAPGAVADMIYAWKATLFAEIDQKLNWNDEKERAASERQQAIHAAGIAHADADAIQFEISDFEEDQQLGSPSPRYVEAYREGTKKYLSANPSDLDRRSELHSAAFSEVYHVGREGLLRQAELIRRDYLSIRPA